jgi:DNA-binding winged helix-turn-helix (wHTH) protein
MNTHSTSLHQFPLRAEALLRNRTRHLEVVGDTTDAQDSDVLPHKPATAIGVVTTEAVILFGPFRLFPGRRLLLKDNSPVQLGSRALEILIALVEHPGELVSKNDLMRRVWPDTTVVEANLSVHIAGLRRALGDGREGNRYLLNMPGRGYRFVAPITHVKEQGQCVQSAAEPLQRLSTPQVERNGNVNELAPIGKQNDETERGVWLIDLSSLTDVCDVARALAAAIGVEVHSEHYLADLLHSLIEKRILLAWHPHEQTQP